MKKKTQINSDMAGFDQLAAVLKLDVPEILSWKQQEPGWYIVKKVESQETRIGPSLVLSVVAPDGPNIQKVRCASMLEAKLVGWKAKPGHITILKNEGMKHIGNGKTLNVGMVGVHVNYNVSL